MIKIYMLAFLAFHLLAGPGQEEQIRARIAATSSEGLEVIEKAKKRAPQMHANQSAKTLGDAVADCINGRGQAHADPIGWSAVKNSEGRWTVSFFFKDEKHKHKYLEAAWEYNQDTGVLFPAEFVNATKFWVRRSENKRP